MTEINQLSIIKVRSRRQSSAGVEDPQANREAKRIYIGAIKDRKCRECIQQVEKLFRGAINAAIGLQNTTHRFTITDKTTISKFLIGTGTGISVFPKSAYQDKRTLENYKLYAAHNSVIST